MSDKSKKKPIFTKEKAEILRRTLGKFDENLTVDPLSLEESNDFTSVKDRTFLLHVLIETLCCAIEEDEYKRKQLFNKLYKGFEANKLLDSVIGVEHLARSRRKAALQFYEHIKQVHRSISPLANELVYELQDTSIPISSIEKYDEAFDELRVIARGGFGTVCMARHKVDGGIYAVKKIIFEYRNDSDYVKVMREVRNLKGLCSNYVVAYNNAWVQPVNQHDLNSVELDSESDYSEDKSTQSRTTFDQSVDYSDASFVAHTNNAHRVSNSSESSSIIFQNDPNDTQFSLKSNVNETVSSFSDSSSIVFQNDSVDSQLSLNSNVNKTVSSFSESSSIIFQNDPNNTQFSLKSNENETVSSFSESSSIIFQNVSNDTQSSLNAIQDKTVCSKNSSKAGESPSNLSNLPSLRIKMMLCIQMEYCDYDLRHWLNARNEGQDLPFSKSIPDIFKEILCGVAYIHEKEIIHRDLKPQNIFFSKEKGVMKVGDFGLATLSYTPSDEAEGSSRHSTNLGTLPYAAPEQRSNSNYDSKVDMYSLGIILIELLVNTGTKMEFFKVIDDFKKGMVPEEINQSWPEYIPLLENLLQEHNTFRMTAKQVLDMPLFQEKKNEASDLLQKVKDLERSLAVKEQESQERELENRALKEALASKESLLMQISKEVELLKESVNRLS